jgi:hypothetical protein
MIQRFRTIYRWLGPAWLTSKGDGEKNLHSIGVICDAFAERCRLSLLARMPDYAESDTLELIGRDRGISRGIDEPKESYAPRLIRWLADLKTAGSAWTLLDQLRAYVQHNCKLETVDNNGNRYALNVDGTKTFTKGAWNWDGTSQWARFWVIIYQDGTDGGAARWWPKGKVGSTGNKIGASGTGIGGNLTPKQAGQIKSIIQNWKPAGTSAWACIVVHYYAPVPDGNWGKYYKVVAGNASLSLDDGSQVFHVSPRAS